MQQAETLQAFLQHISSEGKRSTALQPLIWLLSILLFGTLSSFYFKLPSWIGEILIGIFITIIIVFIGAYLFFMFTNSDALRSETYSLNKMAIERGMLGDDVSGLVTEGTQVIDVDEVVEEEGETR